MSRNPDIIFMAEYIKNVLYFATVRDGKTLKSCAETHYFSIDNDLVYENYYSDFGPLNLGCVYIYCKILNDKLKEYTNKQKIVHYTSIDPKKKANSAFVLGCYGVLYLNLQPKDALKPLTVHGQSYRPFQDATQGESAYTISHMDCLNALSKARDLGFFNFQDFNYDEYNRLDKIQGGDLNWIVPGKYLAFIGPVDYSVSLYHPPEMYVDYFLENNVKIVLRLNKRMYDGNVFNNVGINHYDLFFPDGSCPPRHILMKFLQICEECDSAIAVHCKAGLGRTGSLIGCYLVKHYRMTAHESIGWMRICRPGSVIGHQQAWLEQLEAWLTKQGDLYRKRMFNDTEKLPFHEFGVYSIVEKTVMQRPEVFQKSVSPPPSSGTLHSNSKLHTRPQSSRVKEDKLIKEEEEIFITSCDLTVKPTVPETQVKGCVIKSQLEPERNGNVELSYSSHENKHIPLWKKLLCCKPCTNTFKEIAWALEVRCARVTPKKCRTNRLCIWLDMVVTNKIKTEPYDQWHVKPAKISIHNVSKGRGHNDANIGQRPGTGAGEPRPKIIPPKASAKTLPSQKPSVKLNESNISSRYCADACSSPITTFRTTNGPVIRNVADARNFLLKSSLHNEERVKKLMNSVTVTPQTASINRPVNFTNIGHASPPPNLPSAFNAAKRGPTPISQRRRLGRSPSPQMPSRMNMEQSRATNTPTTHNHMKDKVQTKGNSKTTLKEALSRLKLPDHRDGSLGAASVGATSLGARRDAPTPRRAPSVRSDERPLATQGDLLNSIKFQRRLRDTLHTDKYQEKNSNPSSKDKILRPTSRGNRDLNAREHAGQAVRSVIAPTRPMSPKGPRTRHPPTNFL